MFRFIHSNEDSFPTQTTSSGASVKNFHHLIRRSLPQALPVLLNPVASHLVHLKISKKEPMAFKYYFQQLLTFWNGVV